MARVRFLQSAEFCKDAHHQKAPRRCRNEGALLSRPAAAAPLPSALIGRLCLCLCLWLLARASPPSQSTRRLRRRCSPLARPAHEGVHRAHIAQGAGVVQWEEAEEKILSSCPPALFRCYFVYPRVRILSQIRLSDTSAWRNVKGLWPRGALSRAFAASLLSPSGTLAWSSWSAIVGGGEQGARCSSTPRPPSAIVALVPASFYPDFRPDRRRSRPRISPLAPRPLWT